MAKLRLNINDLKNQNIVTTSLLTIFSRLLLLGHIHSQVLPRPLVYVVGDRDGRSHLAEVWHNPSIKALDALISQDETKQAQRVRLLLWQLQIGSS